MSGILGLVNVDRSPVERRLLGRLADSMAFRGPDGVLTWSDGPAGLGHALFRTLPEGRQRAEPQTIDGRSWIVAHARLDDRQTLCSSIETRTGAGLQAASDAELILQAYRAWGDDCVLHLLGDFVFAIWDGDRQRLFCARDHLGVRPFFYAVTPACVIVGNTLRAIRLHPSVSDALDEATMGETLLLGHGSDPTATGFRAIKRLPAAHTLIVSDGVASQRRYWSMTEPDEIRYRRRSEYVEHFTHLLDRSVEDRLPSGRFTIMMSGGLDSTAIAMTAAKILRKQGRPNDLHAHTFVYDRLVPDDERPYAEAAAKSLGIPIRFYTGDDYQPFDRWEDSRLRASEPVADPFASLGVGFREAAARSGRVALYGTGGDEVLSELTAYHFRALWKRRRFGRLAAEMGDYVRFNNGLPPLGVRTAFRRWLDRGVSDSSVDRTPPVPAWINPSLRKRCDLDDRWRQAWRKRTGQSNFLRPRASVVLNSLGWQRSMEGVDAGVGLVPLEFWHPLADRRLLEYLLAIPAVPWCVDKKMLRVVTAGTLPEEVRRRPKTPARANPLIEMLRRPQSAWIDSVPIDPALDDYVVPGTLPRVTGSHATETGEDGLRPVCLNFWLRQQSLTEG